MLEQLPLDTVFQYQKYTFRIVEVGEQPKNVWMSVVIQSDTSASVHKG